MDKEHEDWMEQQREAISNIESMLYDMNRTLDSHSKRFNVQAETLEEIHFALLRVVASLGSMTDVMLKQTKIMQEIRGKVFSGREEPRLEDWRFRGRREG